MGLRDKPQWTTDGHTVLRLRGSTNTFEDKYQTMEDPNNAQPQMWKGETAFRIKKGTKLPETLPQQFATKTQPRSEPQKVTPQVIHHNPRTRLREKTTPPTLQESAAPHATKGAAGQGIPHPSEVHPGGDSWYREAHTGREYMLSLNTRRARHQATHTLETNQGATSWRRKTTHKIDRR